MNGGMPEDMNNFLEFHRQCQAIGMEGRRCHETHWQIMAAGVPVVDFWPGPGKVRLLTSKAAAKAKRGGWQDAVAMAGMAAQTKAKQPASDAGSVPFDAEPQPVDDAARQERRVTALVILAALLPVADSNEKRNGEDGVLAKADDYVRCALAIADNLLGRL